MHITGYYNHPLQPLDVDGEEHEAGCLRGSRCNEREGDRHEILSWPLCCTYLKLRGRPDWVCQFPGLELAADRAIALQMGHESPALACHAAISSLLTLMLLVANFVNTK